MNRANEVISVRSTSSNERPAAAVFVIDGIPSTRASLQSLVSGAGWQLRCFASAKEFLAMPRILAPGCLLLDVSLPDANGLELQQVLIDRAELALIFLTEVKDISVTVKAMKAGAVEYLTKPCSDAVLMSALEDALERSSRTLTREVEKRTMAARYTSLSAREREVMALVVAGLLNKQIGSELGISETTVKAHRGSLMRKMLARSVAELVSMSMRCDLAPNVDHRMQPAERNSWFCRFELHSQQGAAFTA